MNNIHLHNIIYNKNAGAFEARVDIDRGHETYRYPCRISGPQSMAIEQVCSQLTQQAINMSDTEMTFFARF